MLGHFLLILAGCGVYSFSASGKAAFKSVHVSQFESDAIEYLVADQLTDAVVDAFINDNTVEVLDGAKAEAVMIGKLTGYLREAHTFDQEDNVEKYVIKVTIHVKVLKANSEDIIWEEDFYAEGVYEAIGETEEDGQQRVITLIAADILDRTTKSW
jgi:hypothetical protein